MKLDKYIYTALLGISAMTVASCDHDQSDLFCEEPATRLESRMQECKDMLCSSEEGWIMDYYPDRYLSYGGFVYGLKFTPEEVTVVSELAPDETVTSFYKMSAEDGPVLSFDSYNEKMHFFANPSSAHYEAYDGDFQFRVIDIQPDLITLQGVRNGNEVYLHRLTSDMMEYVSDAAKTSDAMFQTSFAGTLGSKAITCTNDLDDRSLGFKLDETTTVWEYYVPTPTGIRFLKPVDLEGAVFTEFAFDPDRYIFSGTADNGTTLNMTGSLPEDYAFYNDYIGNFTITYNKTRTMDISIENDGTGNGFIIKGMSNVFDVHADYSKGAGRLSISSQQVALNGSLAVWICAWGLDTSDGSLSWSTDAGGSFVKDPQKPGTYVFEDNGLYSGVITDSFIVWYLSGTASAGQGSAPWIFANGSTQLPRISSMVKK